MKSHQICLNGIPFSYKYLNLSLKFTHFWLNLRSSSYKDIWLINVMVACSYNIKGFTFKHKHLNLNLKLMIAWVDPEALWFTCCRLSFDFNPSQIRLCKIFVGWRCLAIVPMHFESFWSLQSVSVRIVSARMLWVQWS